MRPIVSSSHLPKVIVAFLIFWMLISLNIFLSISEQHRADINFGAGGGQSVIQPYVTSAHKRDDRGRPNLTLFRIGRASVLAQEQRAAEAAKLLGVTTVVLDSSCPPGEGAQQSSDSCWKLGCAANTYGHDTILCVQEAIRRWYKENKFEVFGHQGGQGEYIALVNGDIYLPANLPTVLMEILGSSSLANVGVGRSDVNDKVLLVGNRTNYLCDEKYQPVEELGSQGKFGLDYFVMPALSFLEKRLPPFLLGVYRWDNYLLQIHIKSPSVVTLEVSDVVHIKHCVKANNAEDHTARNGANFNNKLVFGVSGRGYRSGNIGGVEGRVFSGGGKEGSDTMSIKTNPNIMSNIVTSVLQRSNDRLLVMLLYINYVDGKDVSLVENWLCRYKTVHGPEVVVILESDNKEVKVLLDEQNILYIGKDTMAPAALLHHLTSYGVSYLISNPKQLWFRSPEQVIKWDCDVMFSEMEGKTPVFVKSTNKNEGRLRIIDSRGNKRKKCTKYTDTLLTSCLPNVGSCQLSDKVVMSHKTYFERGGYGTPDLIAAVNGVGTKEARKEGKAMWMVKDGYGVGVGGGNQGCRSRAELTPGAVEDEDSLGEVSQGSDWKFDDIERGEMEDLVHSTVVLFITATEEKGGLNSAYNLLQELEEGLFDLIRKGRVRVNFDVVCGIDFDGNTINDSGQYIWPFGDISYVHLGGNRDVDLLWYIGTGFTGLGVSLPANYTLGPKRHNFWYKIMKVSLTRSGKYRQGKEFELAAEGVAHNEGFQVRPTGNFLLIEPAK